MKDWWEITELKELEDLYYRTAEHKGNWGKVYFYGNDNPIAVNDLRRYVFASGKQLPNLIDRIRLLERALLLMADDFTKGHNTLKVYENYLEIAKGTMQ